MPPFSTFQLFTRPYWHLLLLSFLLLPGLAWSQAVPTKLWDSTLGGSGNEPLYALQPTTDGGYIMGGITTSGVSGDVTGSSRGLRDFWVVKVDALGAKQWDKTYGGSSYDELYDLVPTADGGYLLGGASMSDISGDKSEASKGFDDYWVVKIDAQGNKQWDRTIGGNGTDYLYGVRQTADGGYLLAGNSYSGVGADKTEPSRGNVDIWVVKLNPLGQKIWDKTYGGSGSDYYGFKCLTLTLDGGFVLGSFSDSGVSGEKTQPSWGGSDGDYWVLKLDALGTKQWDRTIGGNLSERPAKIVQTADGGYFVAGSSASGISGNKTEPNRGPFMPNNLTSFDYWVVKLDATGSQQWDRTFGTATSDYLADAQQTLDGGYVLAGGATSAIGGDKTASGHGLGDGWIVKLGPTGLKQWDADFGGSGSEVINTIHQTGSAEYILGSSTNSPVSGDKSQPSRGQDDFWVLKVGPPAARITGDTRLCNGGQVVLTAASATPGATYAWSTGATSPTISVSQAGIYSVTGTFPSGQTSTAQHTVQLFTPPAPLILGDSVLCAGQPLTLAAAAAGQPALRWSTGASTATISVNQPGTYTLTARYGSGCVATAQLTVRQSALRIEGLRLLCADQGRTTLVATTTGGQPTFRWSTGATTASLAVTQPGTYTVVATFGTGCTLTATQTVSAPTARIEGDSVLCPGRSVDIRAIASGATALRWSTGASTPTLPVNQPGTYTLTATFATGCTATTAFRMRTGNALPAFTLGPDTTVCEGTLLTLKPSGLPGSAVSYRWSDGSGGASLPVRTGGTYSLVAATPCESRSVSRRVDYRSCVVIPNVITANGDGRNDSFAPQGLQGPWALAVFNRWGRQVYQSGAYRNDWGSTAAAGVYYYLLRQSSTGVQYKGTVEVIR